jgi:uncharacterized protein
VITRHARSFALLSLLALCAPIAACATDAETDVAGEVDEVNSRATRFEIFEGADGQHYFHVIAKNGENMLRSEGYTSRQGAERGLEVVRDIGSKRANYEVREARDAQFYFVLKAGNNEIVGVSELYASKSNAERGFDRLARLVTNAKIADAKRTPRFELFQSEADSQFYFRLRAGNGEIVLGSEGYTAKASAEAGIDAVRGVREQSRSAEQLVELRESQDGRFYGVIKANNNEIVAATELYASKSNAERASKTVFDLLADANLPRAAAE